MDGVALLFTLNDMGLHGHKIIKGMKICNNNLDEFYRRIKENDEIFIHEINRMETNKCKIVYNNTLRINSGQTKTRNMHKSNSDESN